MTAVREGKRGTAPAAGADGLMAWAEASGRRRAKGPARAGLRFVFYGRVSTGGLAGPGDVAGAAARAGGGAGPGPRGAPLFEHYGIQLWMPEVGGRVDWQRPPGSGAVTGTCRAPWFSAAEILSRCAACRGRAVLH